MTPFSLPIFTAMACLAGGVMLAAPCSARADANFVDPLDVPANTSLAPAGEPLLALDHAGTHLVAVGPRGMVITSDAAGQHWRQAAVPVQSDLVDVQFVDPDDGWACGHDGVILHTTDGGEAWAKQLDGIAARRQFEDDYARLVAAGHTELSADQQEIGLNFDPGPDLPWLGIWFLDRHTGYAVGSFGDIARTTDGGATWQPWLQYTQNPNFLDFNAIRSVAGNLYIVGEQGSVYWLDPATGMFNARPTGYAGSLFGLAGNSKTLLVFGLRGTIFRSEDQGKTWTQSGDPVTASIMNGRVLPDGRFALVNTDGQVLISADDGRHFNPAGAAQNLPLADLTSLRGHELVLAGLGGVRTVDLP